MKRKILGNTLISAIVLFIIGMAFVPAIHAQAVPDTIPVVTWAGSDWNGHIDSIKLGTTITLTVKNLEYLLKEEIDTRRKPILFINDLPVKGLYATFNTGEQRASFYLARNDESQAAWNMLYKIGKPVRDVNLSLGWENDSPIKTNVMKSLVLYSEHRFEIVIIVLVIFIVLLLLLAWKTNLLRDHSITPRNGELRRWSLGRCQMAWWFVLVLASGTIIWAVTGEFPFIPSSILILLGITGGTALGAATIDEKKSEDLDAKEYNTAAKERDELKNEIEKQNIIIKQKQNEVTNFQEELEKSKSEGESNVSKEKNKQLKQILNINIEIKKLDDEVKEKQNEVTGTENKMEKIKNRLFSKGLKKDIFTDKGGTELYRLQIAVWTFVLGLIFIESAIGQLVLKDFDSTLLTLMGISSGTYLTLKIPVNK